MDAGTARGGGGSTARWSMRAPLIALAHGMRCGSRKTDGADGGGGPSPPISAHSRCSSDASANKPPKSSRTHDLAQAMTWGSTAPDHQHRMPNRYARTTALGKLRVMGLAQSQLMHVPTAVSETPVQLHPGLFSLAVLIANHPLLAHRLVSPKGIHPPCPLEKVQGHDPKTSRALDFVRHRGVWRSQHVSPAQPTWRESRSGAVGGCLTYRTYVTICHIAALSPHVRPTGKVCTRGDTQNMKRPRA
jgi:hypothetical protein